jgi:hypothetical protein
MASSLIKCSLPSPTTTSHDGITSQRGQSECLTSESSSLPAVARLAKARRICSRLKRGVRLMKLFRRIPVLPQATLYAPVEMGSLIAAAIYDNRDSACYEQEHAAVIEQWRVPEILGAATWEVLARFCRKDRNLHGSKLSDWPAFKASHLRSVKQFEASYLRIHIVAANEAALVFEATVFPPDESQIALRVTFGKGNSNEEVGTLLLRLISSCLRWKQPEPHNSLEGDAC